MLPSLAHLRPGAPTGPPAAKRRAVRAVVQPGNSSLDVIPGELLEIVTNHLADPSASPVSVCEALANWCLTHKAPCSDDNVFRMALVAFGGNAPAAGAAPGPFRDWRDLFFWLCTAFTREDTGGLWAGLRRAIYGQVEQPAPLKALLREAGDTPQGRRMLDLFVHGMHARYLMYSAGRRTPASQLQRQNEWELFQETGRYNRSTRNPFAALWWFLKARGGGKFDLVHYDNLDAELYRLLERLYQGGIAWDAETKKQVKDLLEQGASVDFDGIDGNDEAGIHPFVPVPGSSSGATATMFQLALLTGNVDLVEMLVPKVPMRITWDEDNMAAFGRFMAAPDAGERHMAFLERICRARIKALRQEAQVFGGMLPSVAQAGNLFTDLGGMVDMAIQRGNPTQASAIDALRQSLRQSMREYGFL